MSRLRRFGAFWWDFVVGDDWRLAIGGALALGATGVFAHRGHNAWWIAPVVVVVLLVGTLARARPKVRRDP